MSALARIEKENTDLTNYDPERHRLTVAALDYGIEEAKRIKNWPALEEAVDLKIEELRKFKKWWDSNVRSQGEVRKKKEENRGRGFLSVGEAQDFTGMQQQRVSDVGKRLAKPDKFREHMLGAEYRAASLEGADNVRGTTGTGENEWYTPSELLDAARDVLGEIDLDPASSDAAQNKVQAKRYFTEEQNGLEQEWAGRVWLNPPYAQPAIAHFVTKMVKEVTVGRVQAAIMLTHNYTDTAWFHEAASVADAICFTRGRVKFYDKDGAVAAPTQGQSFTYFGQDKAGFAERFSKIGFVTFPYHGADE